MKINQPTIKEIEKREDELALKVRALSDTQKKFYYEKQSELIKDPDTYASLNYLLILGLHHLYLGNINAFAIETCILIAAVLLSMSGVGILVSTGVTAFIAIIGYQAYHLFLSQRIVRLHNHELSESIYEQALKN